MRKGFRDFILRGNVIDLAVAVVMGVAFGFAWTPCIGPVLTVILATASLQETLGQGHICPVKTQARSDVGQDLRPRNNCRRAGHCARRASASASHPRLISPAGMLERYGLMSSTGVPSSMSTPRT